MVHVLVGTAAALFIWDWFWRLVKTGLREHREMRQQCPDLEITDEEIDQARERRRKEASK
jgi:hypothetical protein